MVKILFDEELVRSLDKETFKKLVSKAVDCAALAAYNNEKLSKSTIAKLVHNKLKLQPYLDDPKVTTLQKQIIFKLRARTFEVKNNFKYKHNGNLRCDLGCRDIEDQEHVFVKCEVIPNKLTEREFRKIMIDTNNICDIAGKLTNIYNVWKCKLDNISPGRSVARTTFCG